MLKLDEDIRRPWKDGRRTQCAHVFFKGGPRKPIYTAGGEMHEMHCEVLHEIGGKQRHRGKSRAKRISSMLAVAEFTT